MENIRPHNKENAIKSVAFAFELDKEINEENITSIREWYKKNIAFKSLFKDEQLIQSIQVKMGNDIKQISSSNIGGVIFIKKAEGTETPEWLIRIDARSISITCNLYSRWEEIWGLTLDYIAEIIAQLSGFVLTKLALEYLDEFYIFNTDENIWLPQLFKTTAPYIPQFVYAMNAPWHTHNGFITEEKESSVGRRTVNIINLTYQKTSGPDDILTIQTQHASSFYEKFYFSVSSLKKIDEVMRYNHIENKKLFDNLLSDEMLKEIKLKV